MSQEKQRYFHMEVTITQEESEIEGVNMTFDQIYDKFIDILEANGFTLGGGYREVDENGNDLK